MEAAPSSDPNVSRPKRTTGSVAARPKPSALRRIVSVGLSLCVALWVSEQVAASVRGHAFPYLNAFEADARYGVRLSANARTAVRSFEGRVTSIELNEHGFRGPSWNLESPTDGGRRVLLLGDSQVFGYNVSYADSMAARLADAPEASTIFNAAVPSFGPTEYVLAAEEWVPRLRPTHVVFVANVANDWFECEVPNRLRTTARDGWATAQHADRTPPTEFWGRSFLMGRSHLVFAARSVLSKVTGPTPPRVSTVDQLRERLDELGRAPAAPDAAQHAVRSRLTRHLEATRRICAEHGCEVVAAALPLDVQVYHGEWGKYRATPRDLRPTERIAADFVADAQDLGVPAVNLLGPLRAASPGAFLPDDYHLSPRGHQAVASALHALLSTQHHAASVPHSPSAPMDPVPSVPSTPVPTLANTLPSELP